MGKKKFNSSAITIQQSTNTEKPLNKENTRRHEQQQQQQVDHLLCKCCNHHQQQTTQQAAKDYVYFHKIYVNYVKTQLNETIYVKLKQINLVKLTIFGLLLIIGYLLNKIHTNNITAEQQHARIPLVPILYVSNLNRPSNFYPIKSYEHVTFPSFGDRGYETPSPSTGQISQTKSGSSSSAASPVYPASKTENDSKNARFKTSYNLALVHDDKNMTFQERESIVALHMAMSVENEGKYDKAEKLYKYALKLNPKNIDALTHYGEYLEMYKKDVIKAENLYTIALRLKPDNNKVASNHQRTTPLVMKIDREMLDKVDDLLKEFYNIPITNPALRRAKREAYFMHIYHSNAIEGNTLNLQQTRHIVETRMAINGKSLHEHQEVLGLDSAMRYINETLLYKPLGEIEIQDILEIHRRVLGFVNPIEAATFRQHQVYVGNFVPPNAKYVYRLMTELVEWLNSPQALAELHPVQLAAIAHYKLAYIHPFYDGNGRTSRLLMNLLLMRAGFPPIIIRKQDRLTYYEHLEMANQGDIKPFIRFIAKCTERTLNEYILLCGDSNRISADGIDDLSELIRSNNLIIKNKLNNKNGRNNNNNKVKISVSGDDDDGYESSDVIFSDIDDDILKPSDFSETLIINM